MIVYDKIILIMMENSDYSEVIGNTTDCPYINNTLLPLGVSLTNIVALDHPSLPNYLALTSGSQQGVSGTEFNIGPPDNHATFSATNIVDKIENAGLTWTAYMEAMPVDWYTKSGRTMGDTGANDFAGNPIYDEQHNPFVYYTNINDTNANVRLTHIVPYSQFSTDIASSGGTSMSNFSWITPQLDHDMHDAQSAGVNRYKAGDNFLSTLIPTILTSDAYVKKRTIVIVTWDEGDVSANNQIPTIILGYNIKVNKTIATSYNHYNTLRTIEYSLGQIPTITTNDASASPMFDIFTTGDGISINSLNTFISKNNLIIGY